MAKYSITHTCGHNERVDITGPASSREWRIRSLQARECYDCYKAALTKVAQQEAQQQDLPPLHGTEVQIAWAETIRIGKLRDLDALLPTLAGASDPAVLHAIEQVTNTTSAHRWIEWRDDSAKRLLASVATTLTATPAVVPMQNAAASDALTEATIRPLQPRTETVAEIHVNGQSVEVLFPEKREDFRELVRFQLGYTWSTDRWMRTLVSRNGAPEDRAAELGHRLLSEGFPIRIFDESIRQKAVSGTYEPECTRWIATLISGDYAGWFALIWGKHDDCYHAAKRLKRSKYAPPYVVVPPEHYEEVLDFAQVHGFRLSVGAQDVAESAKAQRDAALTVRVERVPRMSKKRVADRPRVLAVPENVAVLDEFRESV